MRPSWLGIADAVGHYVLLFAFLPTLAPVPSWIAFEVSNPLNARDPVVLSFVLVRGINLLLDTFRARVVLGVLSGAFAGTIVSAWVWSGGPVSTTPRRIVLGAFAGVAGTGLSLTVQVVVQAFGGGDRAAWASAPVTLETIAGLLCGMIATPRAIRLLNSSTRAENVPTSAPLHHG